MRPTRALIASCALAALPAITHAAVVQYTFEVIIFEGPLVDTLWEGEFSYTEDAEGIELLTLDSLKFHFNGEIYAHTDDTDFPAYPVVIFDEGAFIGIDFLVVNPFGGNIPLAEFAISGDSFAYEPVTRGDEGDPPVFNGDVFYFLVPTPGAASLLGLAALAAVRRRRA